MSRLRQFSGIAVASLAALSGGYVMYDRQKKPVFASPLTDSDSHSGRDELYMYPLQNYLLFRPSGVQWIQNWDLAEGVKKQKRNSTDSREIKPTGTRHLILVRHGQYNEAGEGDENRGLTDLGRKQAELTGQRLKDLNLKIDMLISSSMTRASQTADIIEKYLPGVPREPSCSLLREGAPFPPDPPSSNWNPDRMTFFQDGPRIEAAFRKYFHRADVDQVGDSVEVYVCHANVIRYFVCSTWEDEELSGEALYFTSYRALQFPPEGWLRLSIGNCGITWITIRPNGKVQLKTLGGAGHLPADKMTVH